MNPVYPDNPHLRSRSHAGTHARTCIRRLNRSKNSAVHSSPDRQLGRLVPPRRDKTLIRSAKPTFFVLACFYIIGFKRRWPALICHLIWRGGAPRLARAPMLAPGRRAPMQRDRAPESPLHRGGLDAREPCGTMLTGGLQGVRDQMDGQCKSIQHLRRLSRDPSHTPHPELRTV